MGKDLNEVEVYLEENMGISGRKTFSGEEIIRTKTLKRKYAWTI